MDDIDMVVVSGVVSCTPDYQDDIGNGKKALNFVIDTKKTIQGKAVYFKHQITAWDRIAEKYLDRIVDGAYVRVEGHLQSSVLKYTDENGVPRTFYTDRTNAKYITFEEEM